MTLREETFNKLTGEIERCSYLNDEDKKNCKEWIDVLPPEYAFFLLELFENSPADVRFLLDNVREKEKILAARDEKAWKELLDKEKEFLEKSST